MTAEQTPSQATSKLVISEAVVRLRQKLNDRLIEQSAQGNAPWQTAFDPSQGDCLPYNPLSEKQQAIQGVNGLVLASIAQEKGYDDPRWVTKRQMESRGWGPIKGEHPASVEFYTESFQRAVRDGHGNPVFDAKGKAMTEEVQLDTPKIIAYNMYNIKQIQQLQYCRENIPQLEVVARSPDTKALNMLVAASGVEIAADGGNHLTRTEDGRGTVHVPKETGIGQYQAALRGVAEKAVLLDGPAGARRDDTPQMRFVKQQLRVDLATRIMSDRLGIPTNPAKMEAYKDKYAEILKNNPDEIRFAAHDASRAVERMVKGDFAPSKDRQQQQQKQQQAEHKQPEQQQKVKTPARAKGKDKGMDR